MTMSEQAGALPWLRQALAIAGVIVIAAWLTVAAAAAERRLVEEDDARSPAKATA